MSRHRVYVNDLPLDFIARAEVAGYSFNEVAEIVSEDSIDFSSLLDRFSAELYPGGMTCICEDPDSAWKRWVGLFTLSIAAGGVVRNTDGHILMIFRRGKWDLPKGKLDYDESPEHAALREVMEECGTAGLQLGPLILITFHTYTEKKKRILKKTFWYAMSTDDTRPPVPQEEEDIEHAEWMTPSEVRSKAFSNTYRSVLEVLEKAL